GDRTRADPGVGRCRGRRRPGRGFRSGAGEGMSEGRRTRLVLVFGGRSAEHEISVASAASVQAALDPTRYDVITIGIDKEGRWHRLPAPPGAPPTAVALPGVDPSAGEVVALSRQPGDRALVGESGDRAPIDVVFPVLHGPYGEDGTIQGMLELAGVPFVGAGVLASALGMDKAMAKVHFTAAGLVVTPYEVVSDRDWEQDRAGVSAGAEALGLPVFVKPSRLGSSVGVTKVKQVDELAAAIEHALSFDTKILVEASIEGGREIEVSVLGNDDPIASVPGE